MCGIAGIASTKTQINVADLHQMCAAITHRGPDQSGTYVNHHETLSVGLGSRRLSILDLSEAGRMPMCNEDSSIFITYNGEIYNHQAIRREMISSGHIYKSNTDTETILHAYETYGLDCLDRFNGMFAFALYDQSRQRLILARDQMGIKPLYYYYDENTLYFCSELKALMTLPQIPHTLDIEAVSLYLSLGYVPSPYCMYQGIRKLEPGTALVFEGGEVRLHHFWNPQLNVNGASSNGAKSKAQLLQHTRTVIEGAVERQLMSDVPVGVFLSGGIDSSLITMLAQRFHDGPLNTFSIGFADAKGDVDIESPYNLDLYYARKVSEAAGTAHHEIILSATDDIAELLVESVIGLDEPTWETSFISLRLLARLARENGAIVVLTGDGGDELFAGYPWYKAAHDFQIYDRIPGLKQVLPILEMLGGQRTIAIKARDLRRRLGQSDMHYYRASFDIFSTQDKQALLSQTLHDDPVDTVVANLFTNLQTNSLAEKLGVIDLTLWVREHFNQRVDRMSMLSSVEARVPLQDLEVVNFALSLPFSEKQPNGQAKYLLRKAFEDVLPPAILQRTKRPFSTPTESWLHTELRSFVLETLSEQNVRQSGVLRPEAVTQLVTEFMNGNHKLSFKLWTLLNFQLWYQHQSHSINLSAASM